MATKLASIDPYWATWKCMESEVVSGLMKYVDDEDERLYGPLHSDADKISLREVDGIEVGAANQQYDSTVKVTSLDNDNADPWIQGQTSALPASGKPFLRVLVGDQVMQNDSLRPPVSLEGTHLSKKSLTTSMHIPLATLDKLGQEVAHAVIYPHHAAKLPSMAQYSIVTPTASAIWCHDNATGCTYAIVIFRSATGRDRKRLFQLIEILKPFVGLPGLILYILLDLTVHDVSPVMFVKERQSITDSRNVLSRLQFRGAHPYETFGDASNRLDVMNDVLKHSGSIMKMSKQDFVSLLHRPSTLSDEQWNKMQSHHLALQGLVQFRQQELESLMMHAEYLKDKSTVLQSTFMGLMSVNQQEASLSDGKIMKEIAEATKKDSTSMKILALMTIVFLPSTTASAIMAIPNMFNFNHSDASMPLVNSRFWIFFAVAIPLTLVTMTLTWFWLRWESNGRRIHLPGLLATFLDRTRQRDVIAKTV